VTQIGGNETNVGLEAWHGSGVVASPAAVEAPPPPPLVVFCSAAPSAAAPRGEGLVLPSIRVANSGDADSDECEVSRFRDATEGTGSGMGPGGRESDDGCGAAAGTACTASAPVVPSSSALRGAWVPPKRSPCKSRSTSKARGTEGGGLFGVAGETGFARCASLFPIPFPSFLLNFAFTGSGDNGARVACVLKGDPLRDSLDAFAFKGDSVRIKGDFVRSLVPTPVA